jgi:hypothetical protein
MLSWLETLTMSKGIGLGISILNTACEQRILAKFVK